MYIHVRQVHQALHTDGAHAPRTLHMSLKRSVRQPPLPEVRTPYFWPWDLLMYSAQAPPRSFQGLSWSMPGLERVLSKRRPFVFDDRLPSMTKGLCKHSGRCEIGYSDAVSSHLSPSFGSGRVLRLSLVAPVFRDTSTSVVPSPHMQHVTWHEYIPCIRTSTRHASQTKRFDSHKVNPASLV